MHMYTKYLLHADRHIIHVPEPMVETTDVAAHDETIKKQNVMQTEMSLATVLKHLLGTSWDRGNVEFNAHVLNSLHAARAHARRVIFRRSPLAPD